MDSHLQRGGHCPCQAALSFSFLTHRAPAVLPVRVSLPESLYSVETDEPFAQCHICEKPLLDGSTEYLIEKGYRQYEAYDVQEAVFGYAACMDCHEMMRASFSEVSKRRCRSYLFEHVDLAERTGSLLTSTDPTLAEWTRRCIVHDTPKEKLEAYQLLAHCQGEEMLFTHLPLLIGGPAIDELTERLSNETIDELGGLRDEYFGLPPELKRDLQGPVLV